MSKAYLTPDVITYPPNVVELNKKVLEEYKKKPLGFIFPAKFSGEKDSQEDFVEVPDPIQCFKSDLDVALEDAELLANALIGCVPGAGPILQGIMTITLNKLKPAPLTKEDVHKVIDEKLPKLRDELLEILDKKIEKAEIENYKSMCSRTFNALSKESMDLLMDDLVLLRKKLKKGIIPEQEDLAGLRNKFDDFRINIKASMPMFCNKDYIQYVYPYYIQIMYIYVSMMYSLVFHWFTYGYDADLARGTPALGNLKRTHGFREKIHINISKLLKNIQDGVKENKPDMSNLHQMLTFDPILYPLKLVIGKKDDYKDKKVNIDAEQSRRPFIYRIDGCHFKGDASFCSPADSITACTGTFIKSSAELDVKLSQAKCISVRCYTTCDESSSEVPNISIDGKKLKSVESFYEMGALKCNHSPSKMKTGFYHFEKLSSPFDTYTIKVEAKNHRLLFCEVTIFDK